MNCSYRFRGRKVRTLYLYVLMEFPCRRETARASNHIYNTACINEPSNKERKEVNSRKQDLI